MTLKVGDVVSVTVAFVNDGLEVCPRVVPAETAVVAELKVDVDELLLKELTDTPEIVTGTEETTCCDW